MFDVSGLNDYVGRETDLITHAIFMGGDTGKFARFVRGVKGSVEMNGITGEVKIQYGVCKSADGDTETRTWTLNVHEWMYKEFLCIDVLQSKLPNTVLAPGSSPESLPKAWEEMLVDEKTASIKEQQELRYWQGDTKSTNTKLTQFDGFIKLIDDAADDDAAVDGNTSKATDITKGNIRGLINDMIIATPQKVKGTKGFEIYVSPEEFETYVLALVEANLYAYNANNDGETIKIPGLGYTIRRVAGLTGTKRMFAGIGASFVVGMDVMGEDEIIDIWYSKDDGGVYLETKAKSGVVVTNTGEITEFTLSADAAE